MNCQNQKHKQEVGWEGEMARNALAKQPAESEGDEGPEQGGMESDMNNDTNEDSKDKRTDDDSEMRDSVGGEDGDSAEVELEIAPSQMAAFETIFKPVERERERT
ncbi:hypothetical protein NP233_g11056 [Leucocoprinus birnbaumii]|uniref:Uncharacterized protein n=1 Tax=Leucocoprinus birnbaumii TaxID=56174 RepID=A0AAD5VJL1_9AGAR|nr:hypothetical protein NP233_g11056 [Leucocoprinus birnbaumii]